MQGWACDVRLNLQKRNLRCNPPPGSLRTHFWSEPITVPLKDDPWTWKHKGLKCSIFFQNSMSCSVQASTNELTVYFSDVQLQGDTQKCFQKCFHRFCGTALISGWHKIISGWFLFIFYFSKNGPTIGKGPAYIPSSGQYSLWALILKCLPRLFHICSSYNDFLASSAMSKNLFLWDFLGTLLLRTSPQNSA